MILRPDYGMFRHVIVTDSIELDRPVGEDDPYSARGKKLRITTAAPATAAMGAMY